MIFGRHFKTAALAFMKHANYWRWYHVDNMHFEYRPELLAR
jgi:hypothetical protein